MTESAALTSAARQIGALLVFRSLPVAGYALTISRIAPVHKLFILLVLSAGVLAAWTDLPIADIVITYLYLLTTSCAVWLLPRHLRARVITAGGTFAICATLFLVIPAALWRQERRSVTLVLAWDVMLSAYSYCKETAAVRGEPPLRDCLFFLLVNPSLVYARRGHQISSPGLNMTGILRAVLGMVTSAIVLLLLTPAYVVLRSSSLMANAPNWYIANLARGGAGLLQFFVAYGRQSALASIQIGLLRQLGYALPERYVWPLISSGPLDFWRRWNLYVGQWLFRYVFWPWSRSFGANVPSAGRRRVATVAAVLLTFAVCGLLHDAYIYATTFAAETAMSQLFIVNGALVAISAALGLCLARANFTERWWAPGRRTGSVIARVGLWIAIVASFDRWVR